MSYYGENNLFSFRVNFCEQKENTMISSSELANLKDDAYQNAMVEGIVKAVNRYFKGY